MGLDFNLQLQQEQKLIMTQELQLAVKMLQLTSLELKEYLEEQMVENPLIEVEEKQTKDYEISEFDSFVDSINDEGWSFEEEEDREYLSPLNFISKEMSLWESLKEQLRFMPLNKKSRRIGEYIIDNIDENGYLTIDVLNVCAIFDIRPSEFEDIIKIIQTFEPSGVCARNLKECLIIQLKNKGKLNNIYENIIINMLEDVGNGNISNIALKNGITIEKADEYVNEIKKLDPKPGIRLSSDSTKYIIPDVYIEKIDGEYVVTVNDEFIPSVRINRAYKRILKDKNAPEYKYVKDKLESAIWLIKSIEQRMETIKNVVYAILNYQMDFFELDGDLKPLNLKQIANETGFHESTVSRAVSGKYVQTPRGTFEIKNFFIRGFQSKTGDEVPTYKIKERIEEIISKENPKKPYSDQHISDLLIKEGIDISRRTIAKYREEIGIPSSSKRRKA